MKGCRPSLCIDDMRAVYSIWPRAINEGVPDQLPGLCSDDASRLELAPRNQ